jgi:hypothetical protein
MKKACLLLAVFLCACGSTQASSDNLGGGGSASPASTPTNQTPSPTRQTPASVASTGPVVYLHYYIWWTAGHWRDKLGPTYPTTASPLPLPGSIGADGCNPHAAYSGATIVDIPSEGLYDQSLAATFDRHIQLAADAGVRGFLVDWMGMGSTSQTPSSSDENSRLDLLVSRVDLFNAHRTHPFLLGLAFAARGNYQRHAADIVADLQYFSARYGKDPAFLNQYSAKPIVMWMDSRKLALSTVQQVSAAVRSDLYLIGDETAGSWARDAAYLAGSSYYWSTENPYTNGAAGASLQSLGRSIHGAQKRWFAPFIAGYNKQLIGGTCVPRLGTQTLARIWQLNAKSSPDGWFGISWNEFVENTYLEPSQAYGTTYLDALKRLITS